MARGRSAIIVSILIPVLIMAQINRETNSMANDSRQERFGFGGFALLTEVQKSLCNQRCPQGQRFFFTDTTKVFCALNCPSMMGNPPPMGNMPMMGNAMMTSNNPPLMVSGPTVGSATTSGPPTVGSTTTSGPPAVATTSVAETEKPK